MHKILSLMIFAFFLSSIAFAGEVEVSLDKAHYFVGDKVVVTLANNTQESIYSVAQSLTPSFAIESFDFERGPNDWERVPTYCEIPECNSNNSDAPKEIKAGKAAVFVWDPKVFEGIDKGVHYGVPQPGSYRLSLGYQVREGSDSEKWSKYTVRSSKFSLGNTDLTLKGKEIEFAIDKDKYARGEEVKVVFKNNLPDLVVLDGLGFNLQKKDETGVWKGIPLHCSWPECDIDHDVPHLEPGQRKNTTWNQQVYVGNKGKAEEVAETSKYVVADSGVYRLAWTYQVRKSGTDSKDWQWIQIYSKEFSIE